MAPRGRAGSLSLKQLLEPSSSNYSSNSNNGGQPPSSPQPWTPLTPSFFYAHDGPRTPAAMSTDFEARQRQPNIIHYARHAPLRLALSAIRRGHLVSLVAMVLCMLALYTATNQRTLALLGASSPSSSTTGRHLQDHHHFLNGGKSWWEPSLNRVQEPGVADDLAGRKDGRVLVRSAAAGQGYTGRKHPIPELIRTGKQRWQAKLEKQSRTFASAVQEYKRRYGRAPPRGFDRWYAWARANGVQLIDEYDLIEHDLHVLRAFSPPSFRARIEYCESYFKYGWRLVIENGTIARAGQSQHHDRAKAMEKLIKPFAEYLPDMTMWVNGHDTAAIWRSWEEVDRLSKLVAAGEYDDDDNGADIRQKSNHLAPGHDFIATCPPGSAMRETGFEFGAASKDPQAPFVMPPLPEDAQATFVGHDLNRYMDLCESPQYRHTHSGTSWTWPIRGPHCIMMTAGVHANFGDVRTIVPEQFELQNTVNRPWGDRSDNRLVWRGQTSGPVWTAHWPYLCSHRARLHLLSHQRNGTRSILVADPKDDDAAREVEFANIDLNREFLDTGMVGPPVQCSAEDGTCEKMYEDFSGFDEKLSFEEQDRYKYVLDIDGNSWSGRFKRLMASDAAVVKATVFREPWSDWIMPWVHYIPIQVDYSDLWNVLAFFRGEPGSGLGAHDDLAEEIALIGKEWQAKYYRWEDLQAYQFRLLLEWGRLYTEGDMDFEGDTSAEPQL